MQKFPPAILLAAVLLVGCSGDEPALGDELSRYTDAGDGCQQAVSAIAYADDALKPLGQERYQDWDDATRSKVAAVSGTIRLEERDFPSEAALRQARAVAEAAAKVAGPGIRGARRVRALRTYRREAAGLVVVCGREVRGL
jgi:hypothetical protein